MKINIKKVTPIGKIVGDGQDGTRYFAFDLRFLR